MAIVKTEATERLMKRCQIGVGGTTAVLRRLTIGLKEYPPQPEWGKCEMMENIQWGNACRVIDRENADLILAEIERLRGIEAAAINMCKVKGRYHAEIAMNRLMEVCGFETPNTEPHPPHRQCGCADCAPSFEPYPETPND